MPLAVSWGRRRLHSWHARLAGCHVLVKLPASELTPGGRIHSEHVSCGGRAGQRLPVAQLTGAAPKYECESLNLILRQFLEDVGLFQRGLL